MAHQELPTIDDIHQAAERIAGQVMNTPCLPSQTLSQITGCDLHLKFENLQFTASFKERGALNKLLQLWPRERIAGVVAMSAGIRPKRQRPAPRSWIARPEPVREFPRADDGQKALERQDLGSRGADARERPVRTRRTRAQSFSANIDPPAPPTVAQQQMLHAIDADDRR